MTTALSTHTKQAHWKTNLRRFWLLALIVITASFANTAAADLVPAAVTTSGTERWSQMTSTAFQNLGIDQGLPTPIATALAEDSDGFIWAGTPDGLARWEGYRFRVYRANSQDAHALPDSFIQSLHRDQQGRLWIGTASGGLVRYERNQDSFLRIPIGPAGTSHVSIHSIIDDGDGGIWTGTDGGLDHIRASGSVEHFRHAPDVADSLPDDRVRSVLRDRAGTLWVGTRKGLMRRAPRAAAQGGFVPVPLPGLAGQAPMITYLMESSNGSIWIGTALHGGFVLDPKTGQIQTVQEPDRPPSPVPVSSLVETPAGEIWLGTYGHGIVAVDGKTLRARRIGRDAGSPTSLPDNSTFALLRDRSGAIWAGTQRGLGRHDPRQTAIRTIFGGPGHAGTAPTEDASCITSMPDGLVWLGQTVNGVDIVDPESGRMKHLPAHPDGQGRNGVEAAFAKAAAGAIAAMADGDVYIGMSNGLYRTDLSGQRLARVPLPAPNPSAPIRALLPDGHRLWIGGGVDGLMLMDFNAGPDAMPTRPPGAEQISDLRIQALEHAGNGALWIATANGLNFFDPVSHKVQHFSFDPANPDGLSAGFVSTLLVDRRQRLWAGTNNGLNLYVGQDSKGRPRFRHFGTKEGLPNASISKLLQSADGNIWISTDSGLAMLDASTFAITKLHRADGVLIPSYWNESGAVTKQGELLFGGTGGLTIVRPDLYKEWSYRPPVVVTEVRVGGKLIPASGFNGKPEARAEPLTIAPDANSVSVEFASLDYSAPERNRYAYRLDRYDKRWIETDSIHRLAAYTNLAPGDYRLLLRGSNRDGVWTEQELAMPIRVLPAWYQTWWFHLLELLAAALAIYTVVQGRTRYLRRRQHELEAQVSQRTNELQKKQTELVETQSELLARNQELAYANALQEQHQSELTRFLAVASHDLRQPMHALNLYLGALSNFELPTSARPVLGNVRQCAQIMDDMFLALLDLSRLDAQVVEPHIEAFPMASLLSSIAVEFAPQARAKGLQLRVARCAAWVRSDTALVEQILRNLVANAVRYTDTGGILVGCRRRGNQLRLAVIDTGIGITADQHKAVFEEFCQLGNEGHDRTKGLGLGLAIVRRLARLLHTPITLVSEPGRGSMFAIDLPLGRPVAMSLPRAGGTSDTESRLPLDALAGKTIVVVDDESSILDAMRILLEQWHCVVVTASSAQDAIARLGSGARVPDVLICDYRLRLHETGLDVIKKIRDEFNRDIPALIITGTVTPEHIHELGEIGMPVLHKPVRADVLHQALDGVIG